MHSVCKLHCFHQRHVNAMNMQTSSSAVKKYNFPLLIFLTHYTPHSHSSLKLSLRNNSIQLQRSKRSHNSVFVRTFLAQVSDDSYRASTCSQTVNCRLDSEDSTIDHRAGRPQPTPSFFGASRPLTDGATSTGLYPQRNSRFSCTNFFTCQQKATCGQIILATPITPLYIISQHP